MRRRPANAGKINRPRQNIFVVVSRERRKMAPPASTTAVTTGARSSPWVTASLVMRDAGHPQVSPGVDSTLEKHPEINYASVSSDGVLIPAEYE